jgi:hypothetical protein
MEKIGILSKKRVGVVHLAMLLINKLVPFTKLVMNLLLYNDQNYFLKLKSSIFFPNN